MTSQAGLRFIPSLTIPAAATMLFTQIMLTTTALAAPCHSTGGTFAGITTTGAPQPGKTLEEETTVKTSPVP